MQVPPPQQLIEPAENVTDAAELQQILSYQHPYTNVGQYVCFGSFVVYCAWKYFSPDDAAQEAQEDTAAVCGPRL